MATITRGHSFNITDIVNAQSLNDLVRLAQITGLTVNDIPGSSIGISVFSAPSGAGTGWISAQYDPVYASTKASFSEFNYVLTTPNGPVALFKPLGLESGRFLNTEETLTPGWALLARQLVAGACVTLQSTFSYSTGFPQHHFIGTNYGTAASGSGVRLTMRGPMSGRIVDAGGAAVRHYWLIFNATTGQFQHLSAATDTDKVLGFTLDHTLTSLDTTMPGFLFGAPIWRA